MILAGRFLRRMSHNGFFWLPGVKFKQGDQGGDIDLLACCDGHLVFGECKNLEATPPGAKVWDDVVEQFLNTASVARQCGGGLVVLAALVVNYPEDVRNRIAAGIGEGIAHLLLTKGDLELGYRDVPHDAGHTLPLGFHNIIPTPFPERPREATDKLRTFDTGWDTYSV